MMVYMADRLDENGIMISLAFFFFFFSFSPRILTVDV